MIKPAIMQLLTSGKSIRHVSELHSSIEVVMTPLYAHFELEFVGMDLNALNKDISDVIYTNIKYLQGSDSNDEKFEIIVENVLTIFQKFYGEGKEERIFAEVKSAVSALILPMIRNSNGDNMVNASVQIKSIANLIKPIVGRDWKDHFISLESISYIYCRYCRNKFN